MSKRFSPIGTSVSYGIAEDGRKSVAFRKAQAEFEPFERLARVVIMRRRELGLSQRELAERMNTTASVVSRIESGQHRTSTETIRRLARALDGQAILGFDFGTSSEPRRELIAL